MEKGSKIRESVEEVVGIVGEKLVEVIPTFFHSRSSSPVCHLKDTIKNNLFPGEVVM